MISLLALLLLVGADDRVDRLSDQYRDWLEKEVVYIMADKERDAFLDLESEEERAAFIKAFWQRRDPDPVTPVNEFREEHYRRLEHVNKYFGRESPVPGWMTDRGKMYIILGEPDDREDFTAVPMLYPTEVWFYQQNREKGLPPLNLLFWQEHAVGPYRLFNHFLDKPEDLMPAQPMDPENSRQEAYLLLQEMNPELAQAAMTMRADQGGYANIFQPDRAGLDFQSLLSDIYVSPFRRVDTRYVDAAGEARGIVEAEYLFNYIPSTGMANVLPGPGQASFVHFTIEIEPRNMTLAHDPKKKVYYTSFELRGEVTTKDESATVVHSFTKQPFLQLTESQFKDVGSRAFAYRDMFPIVSGDFQLRVVLNNQARTEYTIFDTELVVPDRSGDEPRLGAPMPLYGMTKVKSEGDGAVDPYRTYRIGNVGLDPNAKHTVAIGNYLMAHVPIENVPPDHELRVKIFSREAEGEAAVLEQTHRLDFYDRPVVLRIPLGEMPSGRYRFVVELLDPREEPLASREVDFYISPLSEIRRPWAVRDTLEGEKLGVVRAMLSEQAMRLGRVDEGRLLAEQALAANPNLIPARLLLARFHLDEGGFREAIRLLEPAHAQAPQNPEVLLALGDAHFQSRSYQRAAELFETAASIRRPTPNLLNALGLARAQLGNTAGAIEALTRSLDLDPAQPGIKERLDHLRSIHTP